MKPPRPAPSSSTRPRWPALCSSLLRSPFVTAGLFRSNQGENVTAVCEHKRSWGTEDCGQRAAPWRQAAGERGTVRVCALVCVRVCSTSRVIKKVGAVGVTSMELSQKKLVLPQPYGGTWLRERRACEDVCTGHSHQLKLSPSLSLSLPPPPPPPPSSSPPSPPLPITEGTQWREH